MYLISDGLYPFTSCLLAAFKIYPCKKHWKNFISNALISKVTIDQGLLSLNLV